MPLILADPSLRPAVLGIDMDLFYFFLWWKDAEWFKIKALASVNLI